MMISVHRPGTSGLARRAVVLVLGLAALAGGWVSLLGWIRDVPSLTDWDRNGISIQPNAALAAALAGLALLALEARARRAARVLAFAVGLLGASALFQHLAGVSFAWLNTALLFGRTWGSLGVVQPGLMGPSASLSWTALGAALGLASSVRPARRSATTVALL